MNDVKIYSDEFLNGFFTIFIEFLSFYPPLGIECLGLDLSLDVVLARFEKLKRGKSAVKLILGTTPRAESEHIGPRKTEARKGIHEAFVSKVTGQLGSDDSRMKRYHFNVSNLLIF